MDLLPNVQMSFVRSKYLKNVSLKLHKCFSIIIPTHFINFIFFSIDFIESYLKNLETYQMHSFFARLVHSQIILKKLQFSCTK